MKYAILLILLTLTGCGQSITTSVIGGDIKEVVQGPVKEFSVVGRQFEFIPNMIEVNQGDTVIIRLTSADVPHGFHLQGHNINQPFADKEEVVTFVADKKGTFPFSCSILCGNSHKKMAGQLIVK